MTPGQREGGKRRRGGAVVAAAAATGAAAVANAVAVAGQHHVPKLLLAVVKGTLLHLDVARAVRDRERGGAQLEGSRAATARVRLGNRWRRVHIAT